MRGAPARGGRPRSTAKQPDPGADHRRRSRRPSARSRCGRPSTSATASASPTRSASAARCRRSASPPGCRCRSSSTTTRPPRSTSSRLTGGQQAGAARARSSTGCSRAARRSPSPPAGLLNATIKFIWRRSGKLLGQTTLPTTAGHPNADFGSPPHFSAEQCRIHCRDAQAATADPVRTLDLERSAADAAQPRTDAGRW